MKSRALIRLAVVAALLAVISLATAVPADAAAKPAPKRAKPPAKPLVQPAKPPAVPSPPVVAPAVPVLAQSEASAMPDSVADEPERDVWLEARALADRGQPDSALAVLREELGSDPLDFGLRWLEAGVVGEAGRHAESVALFERLAAEFPERARELLADRAEQRLEADNPRGAAVDLQDWLNDHPEDLDARRQLGRALAECDDLAGALAAYDAVLLREPVDRDASLERARVLGWMGRHGEAITAYEALLEREPGLADAELGLARNESWNGQNRRASHRLEALVAREPSQAEAWKVLAQARYWDDDPDGAQAAIARYEALVPGDTEMQLLSARISQEHRARVELANGSSDDTDGLEVQSPTVEVTWPLAKGTSASATWRREATQDDGGSSALREWTAGVRTTWNPTWTTYARGALTSWESGTGARRGGELGLILRPTDRVRLEVVTAREPVITRIAMEKNLSMLQWVFAADWDAAPRLLLSASGRAGSYSDGNRSERTAFAARWQVRDDARWEVGARLSLDQLNVHEDLDNGYYDPDFYREWGPGLELATRPGPHWRLSADFRTGWQSEFDTPSDPYYGIEAGLEWMPNLDWTLAFATGHGDSNLQSASGYRRGWWRIGLVKAF